MATFLRVGSRGPSVSDLQRQLNQKLSPSPQLQADGIFGRLTDSAVRQFQSANRLQVDGIVGPNTRQALQSSTGAANGGQSLLPTSTALSTREAAHLADDVYDASDLASLVGWRRADVKLWGSGFAAMRYRKDGKYAIAYRGTDDFQDWLFANFFMAPEITAPKLRTVLRKMLILYKLNDGRLDTAVETIADALEDPRARFATRILSFATNRVPPWQTQEALRYFDETPASPVAVVGHSLGGALAKAVSDARSVPAIAFNSPFMGSMAGTVQQSSSLIRNVHAPRDPLSFVTKEFGNLSHGQDIPVRVQDYRDPPRSQATPVRTVDQAWFQRIWDASAGETQRQYEEMSAIVSWLGAAALHYHGMGTLRKAV